MLEMIGNAYRWRVNGRGEVYEYVNRSSYRRHPELGPEDVEAVPILPRHVFLSTGENFALVHECVITTKCERCGAKRGQRCQNQGLPWSATHWVRRRDAAKQRRKIDAKQSR